jgi:hypothetical protein
MTSGLLEEYGLRTGDELALEEADYWPGHHWGTLNFRVLDALHEQNMPGGRWLYVRGRRKDSPRCDEPLWGLLVRVSAIAGSLHPAAQVAAPGP